MQYVGNVRHAPTCYELQVGEGRHDVAIEVYGGSREGSIAGDIGAQHMADTHRMIVLNERQQVAIAVVKPSVDAQPTSPHIGTQHEALRTILAHPAFHKLRLSYSHRSDRHHVGTGIEHCAQIGIGFHATAEVNDQRRMAGDGLQHVAVDHMSGLGTIEIDHMQPREAHRLKPFGHFYGVGSIDGLLLVVAFGQAYALPIDDVYSGNQLNHRFVVMLYRL